MFNQAGEFPTPGKLGSQEYPSAPCSLHCPSVNDDTPDLRGPAVVIRGSASSGFKFYGPFPTIEAACEWCQTKTLAGVVGFNHDTIVLLEEPRSDDVLV